jgi:HK97 family phage prohead protease
MIIRAFSEDIEIRGNKISRVREFVISTERPDSHNTVIQMSGWNIEDYNRAGSFYYQHMTNAPNPDYNLGIGKAKIEENRLIGVAEFEPEEINPLADKILKKVDFGTLKRTSVGFIPKKGHWGDEKRNEDPTLFYFDDISLVEFSIVDIGSNLDALKKAMESMDNYLLSVKGEHESKGFQKDFERATRNTKRYIEYLHNLMERRNF